MFVTPSNSAKDLFALLKEVGCTKAFNDDVPLQALFSEGFGPVFFVVVDDGVLENAVLVLPYAMDLALELC